jgi:hypothetical protein
MPCQQVARSRVAFTAVLSTAIIMEGPVGCRLSMPQIQHAEFEGHYKETPCVICIYLSVCVWYFDTKRASALRRLMISFTYKLISSEHDVRQRISTLDIEHSASVSYLPLCVSPPPHQPPSSNLTASRQVSIDSSAVLLKVSWTSLFLRVNAIYTSRKTSVAASHLYGIWKSDHWVRHYYPTLHLLSILTN